MPNCSPEPEKPSLAEAAAKRARDRSEAQRVALDRLAPLLETLKALKNDDIQASLSLSPQDPGGKRWEGELVCPGFDADRSHLEAYAVTVMLPDGDFRGTLELRRQDVANDSPDDWGDSDPEVAINLEERSVRSIAEKFWEAAVDFKARDIESDAPSIVI